MRVGLMGLLIGFLGGLLSFKVKSRWCPNCGTLTTVQSDHHERVTGGTPHPAE